MRNAKGQFVKGYSSWNAGTNESGMKGKKHSEETLLKMSKKQSNENNPMWKGDDAGYMAIHNWIRRKLGKARICQDCFSEERVEWANISGQYKRRFDDWMQLCHSCHMSLDNGGKSKFSRIKERFNV